MLAIALTLWDVEWQQNGRTMSHKDIDDDNGVIVVTKDAMDRACGQLELLLRIEQMIGQKATEGTSTFSSVTTGFVSKEDFDFDPKALKAGIVKDSDLARRILHKMKMSEGTSNSSCGEDNYIQGVYKR